MYIKKRSRCALSVLDRLHVISILKSSVHSKYALMAYLLLMEYLVLLWHLTKRNKNSEDVFLRGLVAIVK